MIFLSKMKLCISLLFSICFIQPVYAQVIEAKDGEQIGAIVSSTSVNRITLENDRIKSAKKSDVNVTFSHDNVTGDLFFTFLKNSAPKIVEFFIVTEKNKTYHLTVTPKRQPGQTLKIRNADFAKKTAAKIEAKSPFKQGIASLIKAMISGTPLPGYTKTVDKAKFKAGSALLMRRSVVHEGSSLLGSIYTVTNGSDGPVVLDESKFKKGNVVGISISTNRLLPDESLILYLVERRGQ